MPPRPALINSVVCTGLALIVFGAVKGRLTGISMLKSRFQTALVAGLPPARRSI
jgi:VIT1/CCC1 family predicted Fe2+/Mn2+ transporter